MIDKVSIVIPCWNRAQFLRDAIESALRQTHPCEIVVVNDGSTDHFHEVADQYPVIIAEQRNQGVAKARNTGISLCMGDYVVCLDADDVLHPEYVMECLRLMHEGADLVCTGMQNFGEPQYAPFGYTLYDENGATLEAFLSGNRLHTATMFKWKNWEKVGGYRSDVSWGSEDWAFWLFQIRDCNAKVRCVPRLLFFHRIWPGSCMETLGRGIPMPEVPEHLKGKI